MATKRQSSRRKWVLYFCLGVGAAIATPHVVGYVRNWIGGIVLEAIHYHWQWEQQNQLFKPADLETHGQVR